jgi:deoxyribodipyrimidine photolyase-related protein
MDTLRLILVDQLSKTISSLVGAKRNDIIMFCEVIDELTIVKHHKKRSPFSCPQCVIFRKNCKLRDTP